MAFAGSFSLAQTTPSTIVITDNSVGSDPNMFARRVYLYKSDNTTIVPVGTTTTYIDFPIVNGIGDAVSIDVFDRDYAINVRVDWFSSAQISGSTYTKTVLYLFEYYTRLFLGGLSAEQGSRNPNIIGDTNFRSNKTKMWSYLLDAREAVNLFIDIKKAQSFLDLCYQMIINPSFYF